MSDPTSDASELISEATKVLAEPIKNVLSPPTKELGDFLGTVANLCRFYATENLAKIFTRWAAYRRGQRPLNGEDFRKVMPLLPAASMVNEDELQAKWARLMESTVSGDGHSSAFGQTLSQLTVEDVRLLDRLWALVQTPAYVVSTYSPRMRPFSFINLMSVFDPEIKTGVNEAEFQLHGKRWSEQQRAEYEKLQHAKLIIDNVIRLGVLRADQKIAEKDRYVNLDTDSSEVKIEAGVRVYVEYSFSFYGVSFMEVVTGKSSGDKR